MDKRRCEGCPNLVFEKTKDGPDCYRARCKIWTPPKDGHIISWAFGTWRWRDDGYQPYKIKAIDRVKEHISRMKPKKHCPLNKEVEK